MKYYLSWVALGLLMGGLVLLLEVHALQSPGMAMIGLFGAHAAPASAPGVLA